MNFVRMSGSTSFAAPTASPRNSASINARQVAFIAAIVVFRSTSVGNSGAKGTIESFTSARTPHDNAELAISRGIIFFMLTDIGVKRSTTNAAKRPPEIA
jgi:hypothetical protein